MSNHERSLHVAFLSKDPERVRDVWDSLSLSSGFVLQQIESLDEIWTEKGGDKFDVLLLDLTWTEMLESINIERVALPLVGLATLASEGDALKWLEKGWLADYVLASKEYLQRLPFVIRAVFARQRSDPFSGLYRVATELMSQRNLSIVLEKIVQAATELLHVPCAFIYLYDEIENILFLSVEIGPGLTPGLTVRMGEGLAGRVAQARQPMVVNRYQDWEHRLPRLERIPYAAVLEIPLLYGGRLIGVLGVAELGDVKRAFGAQDIRLLSLLGEQAASAIYNAHLFAEIENRNQQLDRLSRISNALLEEVSADVSGLCSRVTDLLATELAGSNCSVWLVQEGMVTLKRAAVSGPAVSEVKDCILSLDGPGVIVRAIRAGSAINLPDVYQSDDYVNSWDAARSELAIPLQVSGKILGAMDLQSPLLNAYSPDDVWLLEIIASRVALMLEHIYLSADRERRLRQLMILSNIQIAIASTFDLQVILNMLVTQVSSYLQCDAVSVLLLKPQMQVLEYAAGRGFRSQGIQSVKVLLGEDPAGQAAFERKIIAVPNLDDPMVVLRHPERLAGDEFTSLFAIPLIAKGQVKGVLELFYRHVMEIDAEWEYFLETLATQVAIAVEDASLFDEMQRTIAQLNVDQDFWLEGIARFCDHRLGNPPEHSRRLARLAVDLARRVGVSGQQISNFYRGALLHDIGKLAIPESLLFKPGPLSAEEWEIVRRYPLAASELIRDLEIFHPLLIIPSNHRERWDGTGYPHKLKGDSIPLEARIFSPVYVWDALLQDKPYRPAWDRECALNYLQQMAGQEFDPTIVDAFVALLSETSI